MVKTVLYTAILGHKDMLHEPGYVMEDVDYVLFTDTPHLYSSDVFEIRQIPSEINCPEKHKASNSRYIARQLKLFPHKWFPEYEASIWMDGSLQARKNISPLLDYVFSQYAFATFAHPKRDCLFDEVAYCAEHGRDDAQMLLEQGAAYRADNMPEHFGFAETGITFRRHHDPQVVAIMEAWWNEIMRYSLADQVSLPYVVWKQGRKLNLLDMDRWHEEYFMKYPHNWFPSGDDRNALRHRFEAWMYCKLRQTGLFTPMQKLYRRLKR